MSEPKLSPCPFCGGRVRFYKAAKSFYARCMNEYCAVRVFLSDSSKSSKEEAIVRWNKRAHEMKGAKNMTTIGLDQRQAVIDTLKREAPTAYEVLKESLHLALSVPMNIEAAERKVYQTQKEWERYKGLADWAFQAHTEALNEFYWLKARLQKEAENDQDRSVPMSGK